MLVKSSTNTSQPFLDLLVSSNQNTTLEQFELPNFGLITASYLNQVKLIEAPTSSVFNVESKAQLNEVKLDLRGLDFNSSINRVDISNSIVQLLKSDLPTNITSIGL